MIENLQTDDAELHTILILSDSLLLRDYLQNTLMSFYKVDVVFLNTFDDLEKTIQNVANIKLVILESESITSDIQVEMITTLETLASENHILLYGSEIPELPFLINFPRRSSFSSLLDKLISFVDLKRSNSASSQAYLPVELRHFRLLNELPCDVYVRIGSGQGVQFIKRFLRSDPIAFEDYRNLETRVNFLWVEKDDEKIFLAEVSNALMSVDLSRTTPSDDDLYFFEVQYDLLKFYASMLNFDDQVVKLAKDSLSTLKNWLQTQNNLKGAVQRILATSAEKRIKKIQLLSLIISEVYRFMGQKDDKQIKDAIFAAFFSDILIGEDYASIRSDESLRTVGHIPNLQVFIRTHAIRTAERVARMPGIPPEVAQIIKEHHGSCEGIGFPEKPDSYIMQTSFAFHFADELSEFIVNQDFSNPSADLFTKKFLDQKSSPEHNRVVKAIKEMMVIMS